MVNKSNGSSYNNHGSYPYCFPLQRRRNQHKYIADSKMTLITKYLVSDLLRKVFVITFGFTVLFSFFSFIAELENLNSYEIKLENIFYSQILNAPSIIYDVIPIATLIGSLWCFASLAANSEFVVFFGSGFSLAIL